MWTYCALSERSARVVLESHVCPKYSLTHRTRCRVEYFGVSLEGFAFTEHAWVQSYGSRYVRPPIIHADVRRTAPMTVREFTVAQRLTDQPVKGMLTGPVTMLNWAFARSDVARSVTAFQLALAVREEVVDLEAAGCSIIQVRLLLQTRPCLDFRIRLLLPLCV